MSFMPHRPTKPTRTIQTHPEHPMPGMTTAIQPVHGKHYSNATDMEPTMTERQLTLTVGLVAAFSIFLAASLAGCATTLGANPLDTWHAETHHTPSAVDTDPALKYDRARYLTENGAPDLAIRDLSELVEANPREGEAARYPRRELAAAYVALARDQMLAPSDANFSVNATLAIDGNIELARKYVAASIDEAPGEDNERAYDIYRDIEMVAQEYASYVAEAARRAAPAYRLRSPGGAIQSGISDTTTAHR